jgi:SPP1 family predicted phage head-tail adaptor
MGEVGNMDRRVSFQVATTTKTSGGAPQKTFAHSFYAWCSREMVGDGSEQYVNDRLVSPYRYKYKTHDRDDINETMRIIDGSVTYNILAVNPVGLFIEILVEKVTL